MSVKEEHLQELLNYGWRCLNCGEHVPNSCRIIETRHGTKFVCDGKCTSETCVKLPPGGNPFYVVIE
jgi:predicted SprT family Zn-dependent metalloprotease